MNAPLHQKLRGFTIVEVLIVIIVIAILGSVSVVTYTGIQKRADDSRVLATTQQASDALETYFVSSHDYPPNLAGVNYAGPSEVALVLYTNSPSIRVYPPGTLSSNQNAQLLLNSCNDQMPVTSGSTTYSTGCMFSGNNLHIKGQVASNVIMHGTEVTEAEFISDYNNKCSNATCVAARTTIIANFKAQGGSFPIYVPQGNVTMPVATVVATGNATEYCLESRSVMYTDIVYHKTQADADIVDGECPSNANLHYP